MAVKIRLRRVGAKKQPSYRVVVADSRSPRDGRFIEVIGHYNPRTKPTTIVIDADKVHKWLGNGALPTESVASLLYRAGIIDMRSERYKTSRDTAAVSTPAETPVETAPSVAAEAPATAVSVETAPLETSIETAPVAVVTPAETSVEAAPLEPSVEVAPVAAVVPGEQAVVAETAPSVATSTTTAE